MTTRSLLKRTRDSRQLSLPMELSWRGNSSHESSLVSIALALGAKTVPGWSAEEEAIAQGVEPCNPSIAEEFRARTQAGEDPLGELFSQIRPASLRRQNGATFTPQPIVDAMLAWATAQAAVARVVDPGTGSGRYLLAAGRKLPGVALVGIESDPLPAMIARANLVSAGLAGRAEIIVSDYRDLRLACIEGRTLFIGNPPYVRHHDVSSGWKKWLVTQASRRGFEASQLAGLHVHFFLATVLHAAAGDFGAFITAAEWMDVNYGKLVRELFLRDLGGQCITVIEPTAMPFPDAATTAAITCFEIGARPKSIRLRRVASLDAITEPSTNHRVRRERLETEQRWSHLTRPARKGPAGYIELGELCRVHRGQVTGANKVWIAGPHSAGLPDAVLFASVTKARELFQAGKILDDLSGLRKVIDLPSDLDVFDDVDRKAIDRFLSRAKAAGAHQSYIAVNRKAWWSVGLRPPAPILATYMARRPPAFVRNRAQARHINIAHGLYPREAWSESLLSRLAEYLNQATTVNDGRTYAGGLTKFEPREMERLLVPGIEFLSHPMQP